MECECILPHLPQSPTMKINIMFLKDKLKMKIRKMMLLNRIDHQLLIVYNMKNIQKPMRFAKIVNFLVK